MNNLKMPALTFSRVSGYYTNTKEWNPGKKSEFADRKTINVKELEKCLKK